MVLSNDKISARQLYRMIVTSTIGISCLLSTDISVYFAGRDGLFCIVGAFVLSLLYCTLIIWLCGKACWNYTEYAEKNFSEVVNKIIYFIFLIRYFLMLVLASSVLLRMVHNELLTEMGYIGVIIPILLLMAYSVSRGLEARARMTECMIYLILIPVIILALLGISGTDRFYLAPVFNGNVSGIIWGSIVLFILFSPLEMILFMSGNIAYRQQVNSEQIAGNRRSKKRGTGDVNYQKNRKPDRGVEKAMVWGIITIFVINIIFYLISVGNLSSNVIMAKGDAVISLAKSVKLPYLVFEKQGGLFMLFFVVSLFIGIFCLAHHTMFMAEKLMGTRNRVSYAALVLIAFIGIYITVNNMEYFSRATEVRETRVEIENREYADSIIIDYEQEKYMVLLTFPVDENENRLEEYKVSNLNMLKNKYGQTSDKRLDLSHVQAVILGKKVLKDEEIFREVISFLENEQEISDSLNVCATKQSREEITKNFQELSALLGKYISRMLENNIRYAKTQFKQISRLMYDAEQSCMLSVFSSEGGRISYEGNMVINKSGLVAEYEDNAAQVMELASGDSGMSVYLGDGKNVMIDKNDYYMNVDIIGDDTIHVKLIYSGKISEDPESEYCFVPEEKEGLDLEEVNEIIETMIFDRINSLAKDQDCDILGIYKHLAVADRKTWKGYKDSIDKMLEHVFVEVEARYEWS